MNKFKQAVEAKLQEAINVFSLPIAVSDVNIDFKVRGRVAGYAKWRRQRNSTVEYSLSFNREAIEKYREDMTNDTIPHEVAHLVCFIRPELGKNHDRGWKRVCRILGGDDSRTHNYTLSPGKKVNRYTYKVGDHTFDVSAQMHRKFLNGDVRVHNRTGQRVTIANHVGSDTPAPTKKMSVTFEKKVGTKKERALAVYLANRDKTRGEVIQMFIDQVDMTKAGASTYYQTFKTTY